MESLDEERREHPRLTLEWPVTIRRTGEEKVFHGKTLNLSCRGLFCRVEALFSTGERLDVVLLLPEDADPCGRPVRLRCRVSVVRVEPPGGLACRIIDYEVVVGAQGQDHATRQPLTLWAKAG